MNTYRPNFFLVGAPKCGTTSMHDYLNQNPDIFMSKFKELNYFNSEAKLYYKYGSLDSYLINFRSANHHKIIGESSAWYLYSFDAAENIYRFNNNAKILIMIRSPIDSIPSLHSEMIFGSMEFERNLETAMMMENERKLGIYKVKPVKTPERTHYLSVYKYDEQIKRFLKYFDRKNIKIVIFDDFRKDPKNTYFDILKFLKISNLKEPIISPKNSNRVVRSIMLQRLINDRSKLKNIVKHIIPLSYRETLKSSIKNLNYDHKKRMPLTKSDKKLIVDLTKNTVTMLQSLLVNEGFIQNDLDLKKLWGYE